MSGQYPYPGPRQINAMRQQQPHDPNLYHTISPLTQGFFSSYPARIKQSQDNALLLPVSYITSKKQNLGEDSDEEFEELLEESDDNEDAEKVSSAGGAGRNTRSAAAAAAAIVDAETKSLAAINEQNKNLPKYPHNKNHFIPNMFDLERMSEITEVLVPIRLDIDLDDIKLRDVFVWNMNGKKKEELLTLKEEKLSFFFCNRTIFDT
jgi:chromatin structure-remodeling complex subunit SFH1